MRREPMGIGISSVGASAAYESVDSVMNCHILQSVQMGTLEAS